MTTPHAPQDQHHRTGRLLAFWLRDALLLLAYGLFRLLHWLLIDVAGHALHRAAHRFGAWLEQAPLSRTLFQRYRQIRHPWGAAAGLLAPLLLVAALKLAALVLTLYGVVSHATALTVIILLKIINTGVMMRLWQIGEPVIRQDPRLDHWLTQAAQAMHWLREHIRLNRVVIAVRRWSAPLLGWLRPVWQAVSATVRQSWTHARMRLKAWRDRLTSVF